MDYEIKFFAFFILNFMKFQRWAQIVINFSNKEMYASSKSEKDQYPPSTLLDLPFFKSEIKTEEMKITRVILNDPVNI